MAMRFHYTYCSYEESGRSYVGSRTCRCLPINDINYFGSFTDKTFTPTKKVILKVYNTAEECLLAEHFLMKLLNVGEDENFANKQVSPFRPNNTSPESRKKISEALKGKPISPERKAKMSAMRKGEGNHRHGVAMSEETKKKISEAKKGKPAWNKGKKAPQCGSKKPRAKDAQGRFINNNKAEQQ